MVYSNPVVMRAESFRKNISDILFGKGLELGPGQITFPAPFAESVLLVDKLPSDLHKTLFPELGADIHIVQPDLLIDFDLERLSAIPNESFDFVIASHLLEHLSQPFRILDEIYEKLKHDGLLIIFLPDRRRTFDRKRLCPKIEHFIEEYILDNRHVDNGDLKDYLEKVENYVWNGEMNSYVERHLQRSVHVHAWTDEEFIQLLSLMQQIANFSFIIQDVVSSSKNIELEEFGILLRKQPLDNRSDLHAQWERLINSNYMVKTASLKLIYEISINMFKKFFRQFIPR